MNIISDLNVITIVFFAGIYYSTINNHTKQIEELKADFKQSIAELKQSVDEHFGRVEKKQDKHNSVMERTFILERRDDVQDEQIKVANHRIEDLENIVRGGEYKE